MIKAFNHFISFHTTGGSTPLVDFVREFCAVSGIADTEETRGDIKAHLRINNALNGDVVTYGLTRPDPASCCELQKQMDDAIRAAISGFLPSESANPTSDELHENMDRLMGLSSVLKDIDRELWVTMMGK